MELGDPWGQPDREREAEGKQTFYAFKVNFKAKLRVCNSSVT